MNIYIYKIYHIYDIFQQIFCSFFSYYQKELRHKRRIKFCKIIEELANVFGNSNYNKEERFLKVKCT